MKPLFPYRVPLCLSLIAAAALPCALPGLDGVASAEYHSTGDAGADRLDFIENWRRNERENRLTEGQKQVAESAVEMQKHLRYPYDMTDTTKAAPTTFEGDELTYDQTTGEFSAAGKVHILQADGHLFETPDSVTGNLVKQQVELPGHAHVIQVTPGQSRVELNGYRAFYRYGAKTGSMDEAKGKVDHQYVTGKKFEFYPDHIVIHDGTTTKCGAQHPDYAIYAKRIEYWPNKETIYEHAKFLLKGNVIARKRRHVTKAGEEDQNRDWIPRIGYDKDDGVWLRESLHRPVADRIEASFDGKLMQKRGGRGHAELVWSSVGAGAYRLRYGYYEDGDQNWVKRKPEFDWTYSHPIKMTPLNYGLEYSIGRWQSQASGIESTHQHYVFSLWRNPIVFRNNWVLTLSGGYEITKESYDESTTKGLWADTSLLHKFDDRWYAYAAYGYRKNNTQNSLFDFDLDDYTQKIQAGVSYQMTDIDRFMVAMEWDAQEGEMHDLDYYWLHDLHCSQLILRYRSKQSTWKVSWQFTPW